MVSESVPLSRWERLRLLWTQVRETAQLLGPSAKFLVSTEAHTYAYSVAANLLLAFIPFTLMLAWLGRQWVPRLPVMMVIAQALQLYLPAGQAIIIHELAVHAAAPGARAFSVVMLAISAGGVFLPLEVALNGIWGFKNRNYVRNALMSFGLVVACGILAGLSILLASLGRALVAAVFPISWVQVPNLLNWAFFKLFAIPAAILSFFLVYWWLPNGKVPAAQVFPAAFWTGLLAEILKTILGWVLPLLDFQNVYGVLGLAVTLLVWGYGGALLLLFGASLSARGVARLPQTNLRLTLPRFGPWWARGAAAGAGNAADTSAREIPVVKNPE